MTHKISVYERRAVDTVTQIELTDEEWEETVSSDGKVFSLDHVYAKLWEQGDATGLCAQCSGWDRNWSRTMDDEGTVYEITDSDANDAVIYEERKGS